MKEQQAWWMLGIALFCIHVCGLFIPVMDVDASQYASISAEMYRDGSWLQVMHRHTDYLDKPPLLFWVSAASMSCFGITTWAYKLPSLIATLLAFWALYRFARLYYDMATARMAAFILASCTGVFLMTNDIRTDTLLMSMTVCAVWQLAAFHERGRWVNLLGAGLFSGLAMLAKGPIGLILPIAAIGTHLLLMRDWRGIFRWQWLVAMAVIAVVLAPMCWGLYHQFDLHPEKIVNERSGQSGLYFFFWEQSFGRITGENVWKNDTSVFTFLHVYAWSFMPWVALCIPALMYAGKQIWQQRFRLHAGTEGFSLGAFVLIFIALSMSKYKLPHYIFVTFPWMAVLIARMIRAADLGSLPAIRFWRGLHILVLTVAALVMLCVIGFVFPTFNIGIWIPALGLFGYGIFSAYRHAFSAERFIQGSVCVGLGIGFVLNVHFYPSLLPYQASSEAGKYVLQAGIDPKRLYTFGKHGHALDFYSHTLSSTLPDHDACIRAVEAQGTIYVYTDETYRAILDRAQIPYTIVREWGHFQVALLRWEFLSPTMRPSTLEGVYLLRLDR